MKIILPFKFDGTFTAYQKRGYEFGIISAVERDTCSWLLSKYCNCRWDPGGNAKLDFVVTDGEWFASDGVFQIETVRSRKRTSSFLDLDWIDIAKRHIENGIYVYGYFDEYCIPAKTAYLRNHFKHSFFIYGFDDEAGSFYAAGYTKNERFEPYSFSFDEFGQAIEALSHTDLTFVRLNPAFDFCVDLKGLFYSLYDYTYSQCTLSPREAGFIYGIDTTRKMAEYICGCIESHRYTDLRYSRFLFEFKAFMNERIKYLRERGVIRLDTCNYSDLAEQFRTLHLLCIKYDMTGNSSALKEWPEKLRKIADAERDYMLNLLYDYETYLKAVGQKLN